MVAEHRLAPLARVDLRRPWEKPADPNRMTPARVRRGFRNLQARLRSPAAGPEPSGRGTGRLPGSKNRRPATQHDVGLELVTGSPTAAPPTTTTGTKPRCGIRVSTQRRGWLPRRVGSSRGETTEEAAALRPPQRLTGASRSGRRPGCGRSSTAWSSTSGPVPLPHRLSEHACPEKRGTRQTRESGGPPLSVGISGANTHDGQAPHPASTGNTADPVPARPTRRKARQAPRRKRLRLQALATMVTQPRDHVPDHTQGHRLGQRLGRHRWTIDRTMAWLAGCRRLPAVRTQGK